MKILTVILTCGSMLRNILRRTWIALTLVGLSLALSSGNAIHECGWNVAAILMIRTIVHEGGHYLAARITGRRILGIFFFPFPFVGITIPEEDFPSRWKEACFIAGGPIASGILLGLCFLISLGTGWISSQTLRMLVIMEFVDMFPLNPGDGGWFLKSIAFSFHRKIGMLFLALSVLACVGIGIRAACTDDEHGMLIVCVFLFGGLISFVELMLYMSAKMSAWETLMGRKDAPLLMTNTCKIPMSKRTALILFGAYIVYATIILDLEEMLYAEMIWR